MRIALALVLLFASTIITRSENLCLNLSFHVVWREFESMRQIKLRRLGDAACGGRGGPAAVSFILSPQFDLLNPRPSLLHGRRAEVPDCIVRVRKLRRELVCSSNKASPVLGDPKAGHCPNRTDQRSFRIREGGREQTRRERAVAAITVLQRRARGRSGQYHPNIRTTACRGGRPNHAESPHRRSRSDLVSLRTLPLSQHKVVGSRHPLVRDRRMIPPDLFVCSVECSLCRPPRVVPLGSPTGVILVSSVESLTAAS